jgi:HEAT repeat protein
MTIDVTPAVVALLSHDRTAGPAERGREWRCDLGVAASLTGDALAIELTYRRGCTYCCWEWSCHLMLLDGERWHGLRRELAALGIEVPAPMRLQVVCVVEEGALFLDRARPDPTRRGQCAYAPVTALRYVHSAIEASIDGRAVERRSPLAEVRLALLSYGGGQHFFEHLRQRGLANEASNLLRLALHDPEPRVRREACLALGYSNDPSVVGDLRPMVTDDDAMVSVRAAEALCDLGEPAAALVPRLAELLGKPEARLPFERDRIHSLCRIPGSVEARYHAARILSRLGEESGPAREVLRLALESGWALVRVQAAKALARLNEAAEVYLPALWQALHDATNQSSRDRVRTAEALIELGEPPARVIEVVAGLVEDPDWSCVSEATALLGKLGAAAAAAVPALRAAMVSERSDVAQAAAAALRKIEVYR